MAPDRLVVVGDAHLASSDPAAEAAFLDFLDEVPLLGDALLLTGDLFSFWFAHRRSVPREGLGVAARLAALARVVPVSMTGGNHDRWGDPVWEELGIGYSAGELSLTLADRPVLALHGDTVGQRTWASRVRHGLVANPLAHAVYRALPPDLAFWLAQNAVGPLLAKRESPGGREELARRQRRWAEERLGRETDLSFLVMGHTHVPAALELFPSRWYLNPGAWSDGRRYAVLSPAGAELRRFQA